MIDLTTLDEVKLAMETTDPSHDTDLQSRITDVSHYRCLTSDADVSGS
jgi:hypothetical protein